MRSLRIAARVAVLSVVALPAAAQSRSAVQESARTILRELIAINTDHDSGSTTIAAQAIARRLIAGGFPAAEVQIIGPATSPKNQNLIARYRGTGNGKPILLMAHLDVVTARSADWSVRPYELTEKDGFLYGRGTSDQTNARCWSRPFLR
jgi:acetylornithine deacetylase/succinyl-diaminopimelate desuccinylase-like protein